jgi:hypothetical protein
MPGFSKSTLFPPSLLFSRAFELLFWVFCPEQLLPASKAQSVSEENTATTEMEPGDDIPPRGMRDVPFYPGNQETQIHAHSKKSVLRIHQNE